MRIADGDAPVLGVDESSDVFHWTRPVKRDHRSDVPQIGGLQLLDVTLHPSAFQLEQVGGISGGKQLESGPVVQREIVQVDLDALVLLHQLHDPVQDGQVGQAQKVHLE